MSMTSIAYYLFLALVCVLYFKLPPKLKNPMLLLASLAFYASYGGYLVAVLLGVVAASYVFGLLIGAQKRAGRSGRGALALGLVLVFSALFVFKYVVPVSELLKAAGLVQKQLTGFAEVIGLSFFTLSAAGYLVDVKRGDYEPERNIIDYALFISFFAHVLMGPIPRGKSLLPQLKETGRKFEFEGAREGAAMMLWGVFMRLVIAGNLATAIYAQFDFWQSKDGARLLVAVLFYAVYLYADSCSYAFIARGGAKMLGLSLGENFKMPYLSRSIRDFWRRWHISLSNWLRDYVYIPLGGSRVCAPRYYLNTMIVFLVSGLWHVQQNGSLLTFGVWGALHGLYMVLSHATQKPRDAVKKKLRIKPGGLWERIARPVITFLLVDFAWIFFALPSLSAALTVIRSIFSIELALVPSYLLWSMGLETPRMIATLAAVVLLFAVDVLRQRGGPLLARMFKTVKPFWRYVMWYALLLAIVFFGAFDQSGFAYFNF